MNKFECILDYDKDIQKHLAMIEEVSKEIFNMYKTIVCPYNGNILELEIRYINADPARSVTCGQQLQCTIIIYPMNILIEAFTLSDYCDFDQKNNYTIEDIIYTTAIITMIHELSHSNQKIRTHYPKNKDDAILYHYNIESSNVINTYNLLNDVDLFYYVYNHPSYKFIYGILYIETRDAINEYVSYHNIKNDDMLINTLNMEYKPFNNIMEVLYYYIRLSPDSKNAEDIDFNNHLYMSLNTCRNIYLTIKFCLDGDESIIYCGKIKDDNIISVQDIQTVFQIISNISYIIYYKTMNNPYSYNVYTDFEENRILVVECSFVMLSDGYYDTIIKY